MGVIHGGLSMEANWKISRGGYPRGVICRTLRYLCPKIVSMTLATYIVSYTTGITDIACGKNV